MQCWKSDGVVRSKGFAIINEPEPMVDVFGNSEDHAITFELPDIYKDELSRLPAHCRPKRLFHAHLHKVENRIILLPWMAEDRALVIVSLFLTDRIVRLYKLRGSILDLEKHNDCFYAAIELPRGGGFKISRSKGEKGPAKMSWRWNGRGLSLKTWD